MASPGGPLHHFRRVLSSPMVTLPVIVACYFSSSIFLTFYQKSLMRAHHFPAFIVTIHIVMKFALASLCRTALECRDGGRPRVVLTPSKFFSKVIFVGIFSAIDIMFSQWSLEYVTITLYTLTKTTSVLWLLGFAIFLRLEKLDWTLVLVVAMIATGLFMFVYHYTEFHLVGFLMVLTAAIVSGVRWTFSQTVMQRSQMGLENPVDFMYHIQPVMLLTLVPFVGLIEGDELSASDEAFRYSNFGDVVHFAGIISVGGFIAFIMEMFEFLIVYKSSGLTLSVVGAVKEVVTVMLDAMINGGDFSLVNKLGIVLCLSGVLLHVRRKMKSGSKTKSSPDPYGRIHRERGGRDGSLPLLDRDEFSSSEDDDEVYHAGKGQNGSLLPPPSSASASKRFQEPDDDFYLKERREWRSTKDLHMANAAEGKDGGGGMVADSDELPPVVLRDTRQTAPATGKNKKAVLLPDLDLSDSE